MLSTNTTNVYHRLLVMIPLKLSAETEHNLDTAAYRLRFHSSRRLIQPFHPKLVYNRAFIFSDFSNIAITEPLRRNA